MKRMILLAAALLIGAAASAQRLSVATNLLDYADFGTLNVEGDVAVARQWTLTAGAKYNPFLFKADTPEPLSARQQLYAAGVRFWPWHVFSGWWIGGKVQYQEYNRGGISLGAGVWGGLQRYTVYSCPVCGITEESGEKTFILPNDLALTLSYVF